MFHRRYLPQYSFFIGISFLSSVYLWTKTAEIRFLSETGENPLTHRSKAFDSMSNSMPASPCSGNPPERPIINKESIRPFPKFKLSGSNIARGGDMLRTHDWWNLWKGDQNCTQYQVHLLKPGSNTQPGALVSFPGSGNSWIRSLLMGITGVYVTSAYVDEARFFRPNGSTNNINFEIPINCNCSLLQKTHDFSLDGFLVRWSLANRTNTLEKFHGKGILVIQNPFKAIQSYLNFIHGGMTGTAPPSAFKGEEWDEFLSRSVAGWETLNTVWIRGLKRGGIIYYERLRHEPRSELRRLVTMLGLSYDSDRFDCVLRHSKDNSFKRATDLEHQIDPYTASQRSLIHKAIASVQLVLKERDLDPLPVQYYDLLDNTSKYGLHSIG